jgi:hypothetical protein
MMSLFSYLITIFDVVFWFFRAIVCLLASMKVEFPCQPINLTAEIVLLFATLPCMILIFKRNAIGVTIYFGIYGAYFGTGLYNAFMEIQETGFTLTSSVDLAAMILGVIIPLLTFLDILLNKNRTKFGGDKKTDWFYKNEKYERELDKRVDKNQYKF